MLAESGVSCSGTITLGTVCGTVDAQASGSSIGVDQAAAVGQCSEVRRDIFFHKYRELTEPITRVSSSIARPARGTVFPEAAAADRRVNAALNAAIIGAIGLAVGFPPKAVSAVVESLESASKRTKEEQGLRALLNVGLLTAGERPWFVIVGASGAARAFASELVQAGLPSYDVYNLAMDGAIMTEMLEVLDELLAVAPAAVLRRSEIVLCITPGSFAPEARPGTFDTPPPTPWWASRRLRTFVQRAAARSPIILHARHPVRRILPVPLVLAAKKRFCCWWQLHEWLPPHPGSWITQREAWKLQAAGLLGPRPTPQAPMPQATPHWSLRSIEEQMELTRSRLQRLEDPFAADEFAALSAIASRATAAGMRVVIVDMPLHGVHRNHQRSSCRSGSGWRP